MSSNHRVYGYRYRSDLENDTKLESKQPPTCPEYIRIQSSSDPHRDLPPGMQMFGQLIVDGTIVQQTLPVSSKGSPNSLSWKLRFDCSVPSHASTFLIAIMRKHKGNRLLGSIKISRGEALSAGEQQETFVNLPLVKVNLDGPLLHLSAAFSIPSSSPQPPHLDKTDLMTIQIGPVNNETIKAQLWQMHIDTKSGIELSSQDLLVMHERILLLSSANENRGRFLNTLGDICFGHWKATYMIDRLNQAVSAYDDAVRDGLTDTDSLHNLGIALLHRVQHFDHGADIKKCVSVMEDVVRLTPDGHLDKPSRLNHLSGALQRCFEHLGDLADLNKSILMGEDAVHLTPEGHPDKPSRLSNL
ncbi:hypothetical protein C8R44DRAFT_851098, partial [Mycena epipterygia]